MVGLVERYFRRNESKEWGVEGWDYKFIEEVVGVLVRGRWFVVWVVREGL